MLPFTWIITDAPHAEIVKKCDNYDLEVRYLERGPDAGKFLVAGFSFERKLEVARRLDRTPLTFVEQPQSER